MMNKRTLVYDSFKALKNSFLYSLSFSVVLPLLLWVWKPNLNVPLWICVVILTLLLLLISLLSTSLNLLFNKFNEVRNKLSGSPKVIRVKDDVLLLTKADLFTYNIYVTILIVDDYESEEFFGLGEVINVQDNLIQVRIIEINNKHSQFAEFMGNDKHVITKIRVKPSVSRDKLHEILGGTF
ncbi:hypothetical protein CSV76_14890 [Sporosarcina sp. P17b]|nr:hypothetical protein CSV76_14890 [Sporosarcina sp. P17b]